ncbi:MAG TPA: hypothetical protein VFE45_05730, partial [Coriobacteriia bacterium]|nr:hypothetical protein [Coriobacteriia bacterium]
VARTTAQWLVGPNLSERFQPAAIDAIVDLREHITPEEANALVGLLFGAGVREERRPAAIENALVVLRRLDVQYRDRSANFEDVRAKYEAESDESVRTALRNGLASLRPPNLRGLTRAAGTFWKWVDELAAPE